jgi:pyruvate carboxylase
MNDINDFESIQIEESGMVYKTLLTKKAKNRKVWKKPDIQEICSIIPGTVAKLNVREGDEVKKGEEMLEYEAMKMLNIIKAPFDGIVEKIYVKEGDKLAKGDRMLYLKSTSSVPDQV